MAAELYIANDDDWEEQQHQLNGVYVAEEYEYAENEYEEEEFAAPPPAARPTSDVPADVYWDDSGLSNCWLAAVADYKVCRSRMADASLLAWSLS